MFKGWKKGVAILHDPNVPERVYAVIDTGHGCGRKVSRRIKANRKAISAALESLATNIAKGRKISSQKEQHLLTLFPSRKPSEIRKSAKEIRCQSGVKDSFIAGLKRFHQYSGLVDRVLKKHHLPPDLRYLPFVESSYNPAAYSKVGAAGLWQIMPATARSLGLELNATVDERMDPEAATEAAAKYFVDAGKKLGKVSRSLDPGISQAELNPFVITSYNYGVNGMRRAINKVGPDFLDVLDRYRSPSFRVAVKNFYASFLAARHVAINADRYFGSLGNVTAQRHQTLVLQHATSIARIKKVFGLSEKELKRLNRPLTRYVWNGWRLIPASFKLRLPWRKHRWQSEIARLVVLAPEKVVPGGNHYTVRKGDTACGIARALRVNCRTLIRANNLGKRAIIRIGQKLIIPTKIRIAQGNSKGSSQKVTTSEWIVRKGDTTCGIAHATGASCRELIRFNRLGRKARIYVGQTLKIPGGDYLSDNRSGLNADNRYVVQKGDVACRIARKFSVSCKEFRVVNKLNLKATIYPGQKLVIPGYESQKTSETATSLASGGIANAASEQRASMGKKQSTGTKVSSSQFNNLLDSLPDLGVRVESRSGQPVYFVYVEVDETLGHFADWLGIGRSAKLRRMNKIRSNTALKVGQRINLPDLSPDEVSRFKRLRIDYHQVLSKNLKENYQLVAIADYTVHKGESVWELSRRHGFPQWLLYRLNPGLDKSGLVAGKPIQLPELKPR